MQPITDTGMKGFLKWLQGFQPGLYAKIAPELPRKAPQLFADFEAAGGVSGAAQRSLSGLGDDAVSLAPIDVTAGVDLPTVDVADAANSGPTDSSSTDWLSSLINGASQAFMTVSQAQTQQSIVNAQLQRAAAGLPPLSITATQAGVPLIGVGTRSSTWLLLAGAAAIGGWLIFGRPRRR